MQHARMMSANSSESTPVASHEGRRDERTHLFLAAMLHSRAGSCPVHVRNISQTGALIEGSIVAEKGEAAILKRTGLEAAATIVWKAGRKAGIAFASKIHVANWTSKKSSAHQARVDDMIQAIRSDSSCHPGESGAKRSVPLAPMLESELEALKNYLGQLELGLAADVVVVATHPEIQLLDVALQSVERMLLNLRQS